MRKSLFAMMLAGGLLTVSPLLTASEAAAGYVGINYFQMETYDRFFGGDRVETGDIMVRVGGQLSDYFASELRIGMTLIPEEQNGVDYQNDYFIGGMLRMQKAYAGFTPYLGVSYTFIKEGLSSAGSATLRDFGYAGGVDVSIAERLGLNLEFWMMTGDPTNDIDRKGPSLGVFYKF